MKMLDSSPRSLLVSVVSLLTAAGVLCSASSRAKQVPVTFEIRFPSQGVKIGDDAEIRISRIEAPAPWRTGTIEVTAIDASKEVNPDSDPASVTIRRETAINFSNDPATVFSIPLKVTAPGEFGLGIKVQVTGLDGRKYAYSTSVTLLAEEGQLWFGESSISSAAANRIMHRAGVVNFKPGASEMPAVARDEIARWAAERQRKQLEVKSRQPR